MKKSGINRKNIFVIVGILILTGLVVSLFLVSYNFDDDYLELDIEQNNNVNNPINPYKNSLLAKSFNTLTYDNDLF